MSTVYLALLTVIIAGDVATAQTALTIKEKYCKIFQDVQYSPNSIIFELCEKFSNHKLFFTNCCTVLNSFISHFIEQQHCVCLKLVIILAFFSR